MEEKGEKVHVPTKPGKYDLHYSGTGEFAPKDGASGTSEKDDIKSPSDIREELDLRSLSDLELDDDLLDLATLSDIELDDDISDFWSGESEEEDLDRIAASTTTLKYYKEAREKAKKALSSGRMSKETEKMYSEKMREILDHSSPASRFKASIFFDLINSGTYMNQFQAGSSCGCDCSDDTDGGSRGVASNFMFGTKYVGTTLRERYKWEKYGLLYDTGDLESFLPRNGDSPRYMDTKAGGEHYGECTVLYNKEKMKGRITYTTDDSLGKSMAAQRIEEVPDQYTISEYRRKNFTPERISGLKTIYDVKRLTDGWYCEAQYHVDNLDIGEYVDFITVPYKVLRGDYESSIIKGIQLAQKKYPNIKFLTRDKRDKVREISVDDSGAVIYGNVRDEYK